MARMKQQELTLEEKLKQALVLEDEQPYKVPGNWVWTKINYLAFVTKLAGFEYTKFIAPNLVDKGIPLFKGKNIQNGDLIYLFENFIPEEISDQLYRSQLNRKCLLTPYVGTIGNVALFDGNIKCHLGSNVGKIEILNDKSIIMFEEFMLYFLRSSYGYDELTKHKKATAQESISIEAIRDVCIPLPPLAEQKRIVDRIESLFAKLDQAKELAQNALNTFETRKAAILHKAFTGELTAKWREENGVGMESWEEKAFGNIVLESKLGLIRSTKEQSQEKIFKYLKMNNISKDGYVSLDDITYVDASETEVELYSLKFGDFLFNTRNSRELVGKCAVFDISAEEPILYNNNLARIRFEKDIISNFVCYYLNSPKGKDDLDKIKKVTTNVAAIYAKDLNKVIIPIPTLDEQQEIVRILDNLFEKEQKAKELCDVIDKIDMIKKAILAKAFRGKLGTNDPSEESAMELLKECLGQPSN